ncbi:recombinase family protein [Methanoculleus sp.]|uniref:recombinase family protein n=1 Tax=Methanoculleus sp. TaxID=90427 RepID=UPI0025D9F41D|nr:recombinase family protein [Methanoculleus sp.]MCK9319571.1 recombinase family protein [Methanoculleus sp.]
MKAIVLARVSTEEQKDAGNSLPAQVARMETYCRQRNFQIAKTLSFDESAYKTKRDDFDKIIDYIKQSKEKIIVCFDKVDRFSRNVFDKRVAYLYEMAMSDKIELHFASDNLIINSQISAVEKFHFGINLGLAKYYSDAISDNVKRANEAKIKRGEWLGWAPIGYLNVENENGVKSIIVDPVRSPYITKMFEMYSTGNYSMRKIKDFLDKAGFTSKSDKSAPMTISMINHTLKNPFYYGMMRIKNDLYPHKYPALITKYIFDKAQSVSAGWHKKPFKYASKPFSLRGMVKCAECGCTITPETSKGHIYYSCTNFHKFHAKRTYIPEKDLLKPLYDALESIQLTDDRVKELTEDLRQSTKNQNAFFMNTVKTLRAEYDKLENRINKLADDKYDQSITNDFYNKKFKEYTEKQGKVMEELAKHDKADKEYHITANTVLNLAQRALEIFESSEPQEKRQLLNFVFQNLELRQKNLEYKLKTPYDTVLLANNCSDLLPGSDSNRRPIGYTYPLIS